MPLGSLRSDDAMKHEEKNISSKEEEFLCSDFKTNVLLTLVNFKNTRYFF
jgi:hypothetical protein